MKKINFKKGNKYHIVTNHYEVISTLADIDKSEEEVKYSFQDVEIIFAKDPEDNLLSEWSAYESTLDTYLLVEEVKD